MALLTAVFVITSIASGTVTMASSGPQIYEDRRSETTPGVEAALPAQIAADVQRMGEFRMGVHRVGVLLATGRWFDDVLVSADRVTMILGGRAVPFEAADVVEVVDQSERTLPPIDHT